MTQDYPDGFGRTLPGHTVDLESGFASPWYNGTSISLAASASVSYNLTIGDDTYIYFVDMISVTPQANTNFMIIAKVNGIPYISASGQGWLNLPLRQNPSICFTDGDIIGVEVYNLDTSTRVFSIKLNGTKVLKPSTYGHLPAAYFTADKSYISAGDTVTFSDLSAYSPTSWEWDFGDSSPVSTDQNPTHIYAAAGTYTVTLKVSNTYGYDVYTWTNCVSVLTAVPFTVLTEVDPVAYFTISDSEIVVNALPNNVSAYVYVDAGVDFFTDIFAKLQAKILTPSGTNAKIYVVGFSNSVGDLYTGTGIKLTVYMQYYSGSYMLYMVLYNGTTVLAYDYYTIAADTYFYLILKHTAGTSVCTLEVYSDAGFTTLVDTLTLTHASANTAWRYLYGVSSGDFAFTHYLSGSIKNLQVVV